MVSGNLSELYINVFTAWAGVYMVRPEWPCHILATYLFFNFNFIETSMDGRVLSSLPAWVSSNVAHFVARIFEGERSIEQFVVFSHWKMAIPPLICWLRSWWKLLRCFSGSAPDWCAFLQPT